MKTSQLPFLCRREARWLDGWTYGDWRQYVVNRGAYTQCARISSAPLMLAGAGLVFAAMLAIGAVIIPSSSIEWNRAAPTFLILVAVGCSTFAASLRGWALMIPVGPPNEGGRRVLAGDS